MTDNGQERSAAYGFEVSYSAVNYDKETGEPVMAFAVYLPEVGWPITQTGDRTAAVADLELFIAEAQAALEKLRALEVDS